MTSTLPDTRADGAGDTREDIDARLRAVEPMVRGICRRRLGHADGDDAAQRALLTLWRRLERGHEIDCWPSYAAACARYETLSSYRAFARNPVPAGDLADALWADPDPSPAERVERGEEAAEAAGRVEALLDQLAPRQVEVMRASVLADRSNNDAAELLEVAPTAVRSAQVRAMAHMRELSGTHSPNPLASDVPYSERRSHGGGTRKHAQEARRLAAAGDTRGEAEDPRREQLNRWHEDDRSTCHATDRLEDAYVTAAGWA